MLKIFLSFKAFPACRTDRPHNGLHALGIRSTPLGGDPFLFFDRTSHNFFCLLYAKNVKPLF